MGWTHTGTGGTVLSRMPSGVLQGKQELGGLKKKIQEEKERIRNIHRKESSVISQLNDLERNLSQKEKELRVLHQQLKVVTRKVQRANLDLRFLAETVLSQETFLADRLVALYKFGDESMPQVLFSSRSYGDLLSYRHYLAVILSQDRQLIEDYGERQTLMGNYWQGLKEDQRELQRLKRTTERKRVEIQRDRSQKERLLNSVRDEKRIHLAALKDFETASAQLQALVDRLEREMRAKAKEETSILPGRRFEAFRGKLPFPVEGQILSTFGKNENPKFNTFTVQKGIEIQAPLGAEVHAVYPGRVLYADWFKGYGKILIIDHGEGYYTLLGHASTLLKEVGEEVRRGEVVALVGDTGSLKGPCLYFEIRQRGKPLDPLEWLAHQKAR
jgi:septal ring factor EnvC (AmiA/AmiB activator)